MNNDDWDDLKQILLDGLMCIAFVAVVAMVVGFIVELT
jgi:hypothetical protein